MSSNRLSKFMTIKLRNIIQLDKDGYLIPVLAYLLGVIWLMAVNIVSVGKAFGFVVTPSDDYFHILSQFDAIVHYMVALSLAVVGTMTLGPRRTIVILVAIILFWEVFELLTMSYFAQLPGITTTGAYYADTLEDIAIGVVGLLTGVYLGNEGLNSASVLEVTTQ